MSIKKFVLSDVMDSSNVAFGTSGVRGLVKDMRDDVCYIYAKGFLDYITKAKYVGKNKAIALAGDLRKSSPRIMRAVAAAAADIGYETINCGFIPTPAVALYGIENNIPSIMVTGSHIPEDRNGIKFNRPDGEILKEDEQCILMQSVDFPEDRFDENGMLIVGQQLPPVSNDAREQYISRYLNFFPKNCLSGMSVGVYEHSSVARDIISEIIEELGAKVIKLGRSDKFVSVDTEAIRSEDVMLAKQWACEYKLDSVVSTDGDGDRPLVSDEKGSWVRGDVAGIITARYLGVTHVVTPVSSNSAVELGLGFSKVIRTRIGSPYVIEGMHSCRESDVVAGYEANGGFLLGSRVAKGERNLSALPTRDAVIVMLAILAFASETRKKISELLEGLPARFTASNRIKDFPSKTSQSILDMMNSGDFKNDSKLFLDKFQGIVKSVKNIDRTDGLRFVCANGEIIHLRPSGNAPELRCYTEATSKNRAEELNALCIARMEQWKRDI